MPEVIPEAVDLVHAFVQDRNNPDVAIRERAPIDKMVFVPKEEPLNAKLGRDGFRHDAVGRDLVEGGEQARDVFLGLIISPSVACVAVDVVEAMGGRFLDANGGHRINPGSG